MHIRKQYKTPHKSDLLTLDTTNKLIKYLLSIKYIFKTPSGTIDIKYRKINIENTIYNKCFKTKYTHNTFAKLYETTKISISSKNIKDIIQEYTDEWKEIILQLLQSSFTSYIIIQYFENCCDTLYSILFDNIKIMICYNNKEYTTENINDIVYHLYNIIKFIECAVLKQENRIQIIIILSPFEKTFCYSSIIPFITKYSWLEWINTMDDIDKTTMSPFNINTGYSYHVKNEGKIVIYRIDELYKVYIHEITHNIDLHIHTENLLVKHNDIFKFYLGDNNYPLLINEAYTEFITLILWNYYLILFHSTQINNIEYTTISLLQHMLNQELYNSKLVCNLYFNYLNVDNLNIFLKPNNINQNTNGFSYIFIKYIFLLHINQFQSLVPNKHSILIINTIISDLLIDISLNKYNYLCISPLNVIDICKYKFKLSFYKLML